MVTKPLPRFLLPMLNAPKPPCTNAAQPRAASLYQTVLNACFALFSTTRLLTYMPTFWAIQQSANSSQHSLITWAAWVCSNAVMAAWLYENNGRRVNRAIAVTAGNSLMCMVACALIVWFR